MNGEAATFHRLATVVDGLRDEARELVEFYTALDETETKRMLEQWASGLAPRLHRSAADGMILGLGLDGDLSPKPTVTVESSMEYRLAYRAGYVIGDVPDLAHKDIRRK